MISANELNAIMRERKRIEGEVNKLGQTDAGSPMWQAFVDGYYQARQDILKIIRNEK